MIAAFGVEGSRVLGLRGAGCRFSRGEVSGFRAWGDLALSLCELARLTSSPPPCTRHTTQGFEVRQVAV